MTVGKGAYDEISMCIPEPDVPLTENTSSTIRENAMIVGDMDKQSRSEV